MEKTNSYQKVVKSMLVLLSFCEMVHSFKMTPLDDYISYDDGHFNWHEIKEQEF